MGRVLLSGTFYKTDSEQDPKSPPDTRGMSGRGRPLRAEGGARRSAAGDAHRTWSAQAVKTRCQMSMMRMRRACFPWYAPWDRHLPVLLGGTKYFWSSCRACGRDSGSRKSGAQAERNTISAGGRSCARGAWGVGRGSDDRDRGP